MKSNLFSKALVLIGLTTAIFSIPTVQAKTEFGVLGGLTLGGVTIKNATIPPGLITAPMFGLAMHLTFLEIDALYQPRGYTVPVSALNVATTSYSTQYLTLPVLLRLEVVPQFLRLGVGGYFSLALSDVTRSVNGVSTSLTRSAFGLKDNDFGLIGSVRGSCPMGSKLDLVADVRYMFGLSNVASTADVNYRDINFLLGISAKL